MLLNQLRVLSAQPQTGNREACETRNLANASLTQKVKSVSTSTDEDELRADNAVVAGVQVLGVDLPGRAIALNVDDLMTVADLGVRRP